MAACFWNVTAAQCILFVMLKDPRKKAVTARLNEFFGDLKRQVSEGVEELWRGVENRLSGGPKSEPRERERE